MSINVISLPNNIIVVVEVVLELMLVGIVALKVDHMASTGI